MKNGYASGTTAPSAALMSPALLAAGIALLCGGCRKTETPQVIPVSEEQAVETAKQAAQEAFGILSTELAAAIEQGGVDSALAICSEKAPSIISGIARQRGISMERRSDRPRNPDQTADAEDLTAIESFREMIAKKDAPKADCRTEENGAVTVRLPIVINNPLCLKCHGTEDDVKIETRATLSKLYPHDRATGYQLNELRGIWRITVPPNPAP